MIIVVATLLAILSVPLFGGKLSRVGRVKVRMPLLIIAAVLLQIFIVNVVDTSMDHSIASGLHLGSYALAGGFVLLNRKLAGLAVVIAGGMMNLAAIAANGGIMPASPSALETAGKIASPEEFTNSGAVANPKLAVLGDIFAWPEPLPLANVFSIGDVVLVIGAGMFVHSAAGSRLARTAPTNLMADPRRMFPRRRAAS